MHSVESYIHEVLSILENDQQALATCLSGLKSSQDGQLKLSSGDSHFAVSILLEARKSFQNVPAARYMLGIAMADLAAAYANLGDFAKAASFARKAISIVQGKDTFAETEANAHMTFANSLAIAESPDDAAYHYDAARRIYQQLPNGPCYLRALEHNCASVSCSISGEKKPWWKFW